MSSPATKPYARSAPVAAAINPEALSYYLALRHLPTDELEWLPGISPTLPRNNDQLVRSVSSSSEILDGLADLTSQRRDAGILLSGGIDSAILAALAPAGTPCFTITFDAPGSLDESTAAASYARRWGHAHHILRVTWSDYVAHANTLMTRKKAPLHPVEVPLYLAAMYARSLGVSSLLVGNGADSTFGGMDKLLARDWEFDEFIERYRFVNPEAVLSTPAPIASVFAPYRAGNGIDVQTFLREIHGQGIVQSFENAIHAAGVDVIAPYEAMTLRDQLDLDRIRAGEPKYLLQQVFRELYSTNAVPDKVPFARPMDVWLEDWRGPSRRPEFRDDLTEQLPHLNGEQRFLIWSLAGFMNTIDRPKHG